MKTIVIILCLAATAAGSTLSVPHTGFVGGELSPLLHGRFDLPQYRTGCQTLENMLVVGTGAATRRPGSVYVAGARGTAAARLMPFIYSETDAYILEFTNLKLRFYRSGAQIVSGDSAYEIATVFTTADLFEIQAYQFADVMYLVQEDHPPQKLTRAGHSSWTIADVDFTDGPFLDEDETGTTMTASNISGSITITASADTFAATDVGRLIALQVLMDSRLTGWGNVREWREEVAWPYSELTTWKAYRETAVFDESGDVSKPIMLGEGQGFAVTAQSTTFKGQVTLQVLLDFDSDDYTSPYTWAAGEIESDYTTETTTATSWNLEYSDVASWGENVLIRLACTDYTSGTLRVTMERQEASYPGMAEITAYTSAKVVSATVKDELPATDYDSNWKCITKYWRLGAWGSAVGYPTSVTMHSGRMVYAKDLDLYFTSVENLESFRPGMEDDDAFWYTMSESRQDYIQWLLGDHRNTLLAGTLSKVYEIGQAYQPTAPPVVQSAYAQSCMAHVPVQASNMFLGLDRTGTHVFECFYNDTQRAYIGADLTQLAEHVLEDGVVQMAFQETPYPTLWCVCGNGELATMYYRPEYEIVAWSRQVTDGDYTSVAVIPQASGPDQVWTVVNREIDGTDTYMVEYFDDLDLDADISDCYYVDSGTTFDGGAAVDISGITQADPGVVTVSSWPSGLNDGDNVYITSVSGMTEINNRIFTVDDATEGSKTFSLDSTGDADWDTSGYTAYTSGGTVQIVENTFSLSHLEGESVTVYTNDGVMSDELVASGSVTADDYANQTAVGLPFTSILAPEPSDLTFYTGTTMSRSKKITGLYLNVYCSMGGSFGVNSDNLYEIDWSNTRSGLAWTSGTELVTDSVVLPPFGGWRREAEYRLVVDEPWPFTVRVLAPIYEVE